MLPQINNKSFMDCTEEDINDILDNPDYRESQYIDYKKDFAFLQVTKEQKDQRDLRIKEFRSDICSFANAEGGYLIYGIKEKDSIPTEIIGIEVVPNQEKFEMDLRNKLNPILPKVPQINFKFIPLSADPNKHIVILQILHDYYAPYIHAESDTSYKIVKREGINKAIIRYPELKNMFIQSKTFEEEIASFRSKRIMLRSEDGYDRFILLHMIPESFLTERKQLFFYERSHHIYLGAVFSGTFIDSNSIPCVDGLRFVSTTRSQEGILYDNGIAEFFLPLDVHVYSQSNPDEEYIDKDGIWYHLDNTIQGYKKFMSEIYGNQRYFGCISIIGCKSVISETGISKSTNSKIDRNRIICSPVVFTNMDDTDAFYPQMKRMHIEFLLSLGIKHSQEVTTLSQELGL